MSCPNCGNHILSHSTLFYYEIVHNNSPRVCEPCSKQTACKKCEGGKYYTCHECFRHQSPPKPLRVVRFEESPYESYHNSGLKLKIKF